MSESTREILQTLDKVLLRSWIFGFVVLMAWFGVYLSGMISEVHGNMFGFSVNEISIIHYCGMGFFKLLIFTFFFTPWLAIKLVLRSESPKS